MISVSVDYRLKNRDQVEVPLECVKDAKSAVRFLRKNAEALKVDVDKVVSPPNFVVEGLPPVISFLGSEDRSIRVESLKALHGDLKTAGNASEFYVGKGGRHGFCVGVKEQNRFFY